jgi:hypothetical protein
MNPNKPFKLITIFVILFLPLTTLGAAPASVAFAQSERSSHSGTGAEILAKANTPAENGCRPGSGWRWVNGPEQPDAAVKAQRLLEQKGIDSTVSAYGFGEVDSCGNFRLSATDFTIALAPGAAASAEAQSAQASSILDELGGLAEPRLGNVRIAFEPGESKFYPAPEPAPQIEPQVSAQAGATDVLNKNVYLLVYDPILSDEKDLITRMGWYSPATLAQELSDTFKSISHGQLQYTIPDPPTVLNEWPVKVDGFRYDETSYLYAYDHPAEAHNPDLVDYDAIIGDPALDICGKVNRGEIDELWIYGAPFDGFYESRLVGPDAYWFNSPPMEETHGCNKLLPVMGLSYERGIAEALEAFGHRSESIMDKVYGGWETNSIDHNWERYTLNKTQSPNYSYSGCGSIHYPPNGVKDYDWNNHTSVLSNCEDFNNYPNMDLSNPPSALKEVDCQAWGCDDINEYAGNLGYMLYWFSHLPANNGFGPDSVSNNWWQYLSDPSRASTYFEQPCRGATPQWKGLYWDNSEMKGDPVLCQDTPSIIFNWGEDSPNPALPVNNFAAHWSRTIYFPANTYRFWISHGGGTRLYIDDTLMLDRWSTINAVDSLKWSLAAGNHTIRIEMSHSDGPARAEFWWTNPPSVPALVSPGNKALTTDYRPRLDWKTSSLPGYTSFDNYQLQVATNNTFDTPLIDVQLVDRINSEFTPEDNLAPNTVFYWRVRAFNSIGNYSAWSSVRSFRTALEPPVLVSPAEAESMDERRPSLDWQSVDGASSYTVQILRYATMRKLVMTGKTIESGFNPPSDLPAATTLYWRVRANGINGPSAWSNAGSFTTGDPPGTPVLASPANKKLISGYQTKLEWKPSSLPDGTEFEYYLVQVATDDQFHHPLIKFVTDRTASEFTLESELDPDKVYYWRVQAYNKNANDIENYSAWSNVRSFRTLIKPPELAIPEDQTTLSGLQPKLEWIDNGARKYAVQISRYANFKKVLKSAVTFEPSYTPPPNLPANVPLFWRVRAYGVNGTSAWSDPWSFTSTSAE